MDNAVRLEQPQKPQKPDSESISASVSPLGTDWTPDTVFTLIGDLSLRPGHPGCTLATCLKKSEGLDSHYCWGSHMNDPPQRRKYQTYGSWMSRRRLFDINQTQTTYVHGMVCKATATPEASRVRVIYSCRCSGMYFHGGDIVSERHDHPQVPGRTAMRWLPSDAADTRAADADIL